MIPQISIQSQRGRIGIESQLGQYEIHRPQPDVEIKSTPARITAENRPGELKIDQTLTNNALTGGKHEAFWSRLYAQYQDVARQNLIHMVEKGNLMGDLRIKRNPMPDLALDEFIEGAPDLQIYGHASPANISFSYMPHELNMQVEEGAVQVDVLVHKPEIQYHRGYVRIYMEQYPSLTITPPVINMRV